MAWHIVRELEKVKGRKVVGVRTGRWTTAKAIIVKGYKGSRQ